MAFQLQPDESMSKGFQRLARKELKAAVGEIRRSQSPRDDAVHEARKHVKKVRAILQLIDDDDGDGLDRCEKRLRSVNRKLSELRDADVMMETLASLRKRYPHLFSEHTFALAQRMLSARKRDAWKAAERAGAWSGVDQQLGRVRRLAKRWQPAHRGRAALLRGIRAVHRRGRKAMKRARNGERADDFHAWRKEIKGLWYALRLVEQSDARLRQDVRALHQAETWLGEEHNLVVLCDELARDATICHTPVDVDRLRLATHRDQCRLREKAVARVRRLYQRRSGAYARRAGSAWKEWRRHSREDRADGRRRAAA